jgi:translation initiation factor 2A
MVFSTDGKYLMISELKEKVSVFDTAENVLLKSLAFRNVQNMYISEANKYALVMDKNTVDSFDLYVLRFPSMETLKKIEHKRYKKEQWPLVRFINRDKYLVYILNQTLQIY